MSELQRTILRLALAGKQLPDRNPERGGADVYYGQVLADYFGFEPVVKDLRYSGHKFDRKAIGVKRYAAAQAALSRAMVRLERRGLVRLFSGAIARWSGANITDEGIEAVNKVPACNFVNRDSDRLTMRQGCQNVSRGDGAVNKVANYHSVNRKVVASREVAPA